MLNLQQLTENVTNNEQAGKQSLYTHKGGADRAGLTIFTGTLKNPVLAYRITVTGSNVKVTVTTGTSDESRTVCDPPARFVATGNVTVFAAVDDEAADAIARVRVEYVQAGEPPNVVEWLDSTGGAVGLQENAIGFRAAVACTLTVQGNAVTLAAGDFIELRQPATLNTGFGAQLLQP